MGGAGWAALGHALWQCRGGEASLRLCEQRGCRGTAPTLRVPQAPRRGADARFAPAQAGAVTVEPSQPHPPRAVFRTLRAKPPIQFGIADYPSK